MEITICSLLLPFISLLNVLIEPRKARGSPWEKNYLAPNGKSAEAKKAWISSSIFTTILEGRDHYYCLHFVHEKTLTHRWAKRLIKLHSAKGLTPGLNSGLQSLTAGAPASALFFHKSCLYWELGIGWGYIYVLYKSVHVCVCACTCIFLTSRSWSLGARHVWPHAKKTK